MVQFHSLKVADAAKDTDDVVVLTFDVPANLKDTFQFTQGQHLVVRTNLNGNEVRRTYSICAGVDDHVLRIAVKYFPGGAFSTFVHEKLKVGDTLDVMPPVGHFFTPLDSSNRKTYVAFAENEGITPILSLIKTTLVREPFSRFVLFYGNETVNSIMFREEIEDLKNIFMTRFSIFHVLSREEQDVDILNGRIDGAKAKTLIDAVVPADLIDDVFICCPQHVTDDIKAALEDLGIDKSHIHFELFHTDSASSHQATPLVKELQEGSAHVTLTLNGVKTDFDMPMNGETTVLEVARDKDIDAPYSCKDGVCGTCRAKLVEGKVDMALNYALEDDEVEAGFILTCQARPLTNKIVIDYDQA